MMGGFLAELKLKSDQDFATVYQLSAWFGLRRSGNIWVWDTNDEALTEPTNWDDGEPKDTADCAFTSEGKWSSSDCSSDINGALCQYRLGKSITSNIYSRRTDIFL